MVLIWENCSQPRLLHLTQHNVALVIILKHKFDHMLCHALSSFMIFPLLKGELKNFGPNKLLSLFLSIAHIKLCSNCEGLLEVPGMSHDLFPLCM